MLIDAGSFGVSMVALLLMRPRPAAASASRALNTVVHEMGEGLVYVRRHAWLWGTLVAASVSLLCFMGPMRVLVPFVVKNDLHGSASDLGLVFAVGGVGAIIASIAFSQLGVPARPVIVMFVTWGLSVYAIAGFGLAGALWQLALVSFVSNALATFGLLIWATLLGTRVPRELLGRVSSLDWMLSIGLVPVSFIATGPIAELIGVAQTLVLAGVLGGTVFLAFLLLPEMRAPSHGRQTASWSPSPS